MGEQEAQQAEDSTAAPPTPERVSRRASALRKLIKAAKAIGWAISPKGDAIARMGPAREHGGEFRVRAFDLRAAAARERRRRAGLEVTCG